MDVTGLLRGHAKRPGSYPRPVFVLVGQVVVWVDGVANCHLDAAMRQVPVDGVVAVMLDDDVRRPICSYSSRDDGPFLVGYDVCIGVAVDVVNSRVFPTVI